MDRKKDIIKAIKSISGKYSEYEIFTDWIRCCSLSISNSCQCARDNILGHKHDAVWEERERMYLDTIRKYSQEEGKLFVSMLGMLCETMEENPSDVLGEIYMQSGMGSKAAGQFFTPFHLSLATAKLSLEGIEDEVIRINEPSCGGGGMIIAVAVALKEQGRDYQHCMKVVAQDLDWKGVYMCYLQLSLLGIDAICVQGSTLTEPYADGYPEERALRTPRNWGIIV